MAVTVPSGDKYKNIRGILAILERDFPDLVASVTDARMERWIKEINEGGRTDDDVRDDIAKYIIGEERLMQTYGITAEEAQKVILGGNEGGTNFSELTVSDPGVGLEKKTPPEEDLEEEGVGVGELTILTSDEMNWYFDPSSGKWMVSYGLPGSDREVVFEATPEQMDTLFGEGFRPEDFDRISTRELLARDGVTFAGDISEMEGTGSFEGEMERVIALALDEGKLPEWAEGSAEIMDILFIAQSEGKSNNWVLEQISGTAEFEQRFPGIKTMQKEGNMELAEAVTGYLEYEAGVNAAMKASGLDQETTPELVGELINAGHSLTVINSTVQGFNRMQKFAPALKAFNDVLAGQGLDTITNINDILDFVAGRSSSEVYDIYEATSIQEAAVGAGLGHIFSVQDAMDVAYATDQTLQSATQGMAKAAEMLLRMRHEVDTGKFGLEESELIDISLGMAPRSGRTGAEINESINRAVSSARGSLQKRAQAFKSFDTSGTPQVASLRRARQAE